jgi:hypothetical protein
MSIGILVTAVFGIIAVAVLAKLISYPIRFFVWLFKFTFNVYNTLFEIILSRKTKKDVDDKIPTDAFTDKIEFVILVPFQKIKGEEEWHANITIAFSIIDDTKYSKFEGDLEDLLARRLGPKLLTILVNLSEKKTLNRYIGFDISRFVDNDLDAVTFVQGAKTAIGVELKSIILTSVLNQIDPKEK